MPIDRISHCSHYARSTSHEHPIGTATGFSRSFLLEIPLPWAKSALDSFQVPQAIKDALAAYRESVGDVNATLLVPDVSYATDGARLIDIQVVDGRITKRDVIARDGDIAAIIRSLAGNEQLPADAVVDDAPYRDIVVCTHGSRDACCGTFGVPIYAHLRELGRNTPSTRVWRSSHLGGHRFAPTLIDYPSGRSWGFVDAAVAESIFSHTAPPEALQAHYRGWVGHRDVALQLLEGQALASIGWQWNEYRQTGSVLAHDEQGRGVEVEIVATHPQLPAINFRGEIEWGEEFTTFASCNAAPVTYQRKTLVEFERMDLARSSKA